MQYLVTVEAKEPAFVCSITLPGTLPARERVSGSFTETQMAIAITAGDLACYALYSNDYHHSKEWGNSLIGIWCAAKRDFQKSGGTVHEFRDTLREAIFEIADIRSDFEEACREAGADPEDDDLFHEYHDMHVGSAFDLIPANLYAEFVWIPGWVNEDLDDLMYLRGLKSDHWKSNYIEDVLPGEWLETFLKMVNVNSVDLIGESIQTNKGAGRKLAEKFAAVNFKFSKDPNKASLMTPREVIAAIENAYFLALPMFHCFINVRALFEHDPTQPMRMTTEKRGEVHLGFHEPVNGAGYMDTYKGEIIIPADAVGFAGENRWSYGIDKTYGLVTSVFRTTPQ